MQLDTTRLEDADRCVQLLDVVADPVRWRLVSELAQRGTLCFCDLKPIAGLAANELSYHLKEHLPELILLRRVLQPKLLATSFGVVAGGIVAVGYLFNALAT